MSENTDKLSEACKVAGIVAGEEVQIAELEKQIANKFHEITKKIFGENKFRMKKITVWAGEDIGTVYAGILAVLEDHVIFDGDFHGYVDTLRITPSGVIMRIGEHVESCQSYDLHELGEIVLAPYDVVYRKANNHEIATAACDLATELLAALKQRIDTSKAEKEVLKSIAGKI
jgi:hypothetical protein